MIARTLGCIVALALGGGIVWALDGWVADSDAQAAGWASVPERSWVQLEDLPPATPVLISVGLAEPNDATGLALYARQVEDCDTVTRTDSDGKTTTRTECDWETVERWLPHPLRVVTAAEGELLTVVYEAPALSGPQRYVNLGWRERAVGWAEGDALTVAGRSGDEPRVVTAVAVSSLSRAEWIASQTRWPWAGRFFQALAIGVAVVVCLYLVLVWEPH